MWHKKNESKERIDIANEDVTSAKILQNTETENQWNSTKNTHEGTHKTIGKNKANSLMHIQSQNAKKQSIKHARNCAQYTWIQYEKCKAEKKQ